MSKIQLYRDVIEFTEEYLDIDCKLFREELAEHLEDYDDDFHIDHGSRSWRFISDTAIEDIHYEEVKDMVQDCYLNGTDVDKYWWLEIDWEKTVDNLKSADGYGHHFSHYDGSEEEYDFADASGSGVSFSYWIFRTN